MNGNGGGIFRVLIAPIITGLISAGVALATWTYFQAQSVALLEYKSSQIEKHNAEQDQRLDAQSDAILQLKDEVRNVNSLKLQMENNRAIIEVYGRRIERQEERK